MRCLPLWWKGVTTVNAHMTMQIISSPQPVNRYVHSLNVNEYLWRQNTCYLMDGQIVKYECGVYGAYMQIAFIVIHEMIRLCYRS